MTELDSTKRSQIAQRLKEARKLAGLSQGHVAKTLGLHRPSVSEIESGNRRVSAGAAKEFLPNSFASFILCRSSACAVPSRCAGRLRKRRRSSPSRATSASEYATLLTHLYAGVNILSRRAATPQRVTPRLCAWRPSAR
ncbi:helix-turn-helix transcriptional regulator [Bradyrhizobium sp. 138]|uniref:helix-turn-helix domain-containing protein n=1 Tax=Bradyrhizobium sp. 138 TaxID=2782615 RepID=UPI001FF73499|nr:helix-turn-helix transcriptional regulator [Bradyrhizobium sp. 138]